MLADFFTKPLQGMQFQKLRDQMMNIDPSSAYHSSNLGHRSVLKIKLPGKPSPDEVSTSATLTTSYKEVLLGSETTKKTHSLSFISKCYTDSLVCIRFLLLSNRPEFSPRFNLYINAKNEPSLSASNFHLKRYDLFSDCELPPKLEITQRPGILL
jgi:hypothetical protein